MVCQCQLHGRQCLDQDVTCCKRRRQRGVRARSYMRMSPWREVFFWPLGYEDFHEQNSESLESRLSMCAEDIKEELKSSENNLGDPSMESENNGGRPTTRFPLSTLPSKTAN